MSRELDALVAEKVMGWQVSSSDTAYARTPDGRVYLCRLPKFSTDIAAAWLALEEMRKRFTNASLCADNGWGLTLWNITGSGGHRDVCGPVNAPTAAEAICRAALLAVGHKEKP